MAFKIKAKINHTDVPYMDYSIDFNALHMQSVSYVLI